MAWSVEKYDIHYNDFLRASVNNYNIGLCLFIKNIYTVAIKIMYFLVLIYINLVDGSA